MDEAEDLVPSADGPHGHGLRNHSKAKSLLHSLDQPLNALVPQGCGATASMAELISIVVALIIHSPISQCFSYC